MSPNAATADPLPYVVVVDAEYESEWYLTPKRFPNHLGALRYAAGIAISFFGRPNAPTISINGPEGGQTFRPHALRFIGWTWGWFDEFYEG